MTEHTASSRRSSLYLDCILSKSTLTPTCPLDLGTPLTSSIFLAYVPSPSFSLIAMSPTFSLSFYLSNGNSSILTTPQAVLHLKNSVSSVGRVLSSMIESSLRSLPSSRMDDSVHSDLQVARN